MQPLHVAVPLPERGDAGVEGDTAAPADPLAQRKSKIDSSIFLEIHVRPALERSPVALFPRYVGME